MLKSGKKFHTLRDQKKNSNSRVVRKKISERKIIHKPPLQVEWSVPKYSACLLSSSVVGDCFNMK